MNIMLSLENNVGIGQELNGAEQVAHASYVRNGAQSVTVSGQVATLTVPDEAREILASGWETLSEIDSVPLLMKFAKPWELFQFSSKNYTPALSTISDPFATTHNEDGSAYSWNGGKTILTSYYTDAMLDHYGQVTNGTAHMSFANHFRAFADWIGLDGELGIQGSYGRDSINRGGTYSDGGALRLPAVHPLVHRTLCLGQIHLLAVIGEIHLTQIILP